MSIYLGTINESTYDQDNNNLANYNKNSYTKTNLFDDSSVLGTKLLSSVVSITSKINNKYLNSDLLESIIYGEASLPQYEGLTDDELDEIKSEIFSSFNIHYIDQPNPTLSIKTRIDSLNKLITNTNLDEATSKIIKTGILAYAMRQGLSASEESNLKSELNL
jgi:hypothetical protein